MNLAGCGGKIYHRIRTTIGGFYVDTTLRFKDLTGKPFTVTVGKDDVAEVIEVPEGINMTHGIAVSPSDYKASLFIFPYQYDNDSIFISFRDTTEFNWDSYMKEEQHVKTVDVIRGGGSL